MQDSKDKTYSECESCEKRTFLISLSCLLVGSVGYFLLSRDVWIFYLFAHLGALGVMGLSGVAAGVLARKKHRGYWTAFSLGFLLPIILGIVAVLIFWLGEDGKLYCGGSVSLVVAILVIVFYLLAKKKKPSQAGYAG